MTSKPWILIAIIIALAILGYGYMNYSYKMKVFERENNLEALRMTNLETCKRYAIEAYQTNWNGECEINGIDKKTENCTLPKYIADDEEARREKAIDNSLNKNGN